MDNLKKQRIIGFDFDGVIIDHTKSKIMLARKYGYEISKAQTPSDIMRKIIPEEKFHNIMSELYESNALKDTSVPFPSLFNVLDKIKNKYPYFLISKRKRPEVASELMKHHGIWPHYFNTDNSFFVPNYEEKNISAGKLNISHFIDDELIAINAFSNVKNRILFDPHNAFGENKGYIKASSWQDIINSLN